MPRNERDRAANQLLMVASAVVVVAALYLAQDVLIPLALAVLLSFLLAPLATRLERLGLWRVPAVLVVSGFAFMVIGGVAWLVVDQLADLVQSLPQYRFNIQSRIEAVREAGQGRFDRAFEFFGELQEDIVSPPEPDFPEYEPDPEPDPVPVTIIDSTPGPMQIARYAGPLLGPLVTTGLTVIFTLFFLVQRDELRDRIIRLAGLGRIDVTTKALSDAGSRISRYLIAQVIINVSYGIPVGIVLWLIGLPNALLFGVLAALVRFVPFIGPWVGALLPVTLSLAVFDDWTRPLMIISMFVGFELFSNNVMEPWLYGSSTGMSMVAVMLAVVFWTWLWGAVGVLLATPLTVCILVLGKYVDRLSFLDIILSDEAVLAPRSRFYQRLLARDHDDVAELSEQLFTEYSLIDVYDQVMIPVLHMAERDRHRGRLDETQRRFIYDTMREMVHHLGQLKVDAEVGRLSTDPQEAKWRATLDRARTIPIVCLPARDEADQLAAEMFAQTLVARGLNAQSITIDSLAGERLARVAELHAPIVCINALPPSAVMHARYLYKRLKQQDADAVRIVGLWNFTGDMSPVRERIGCEEHDCVVTTFADGLQQVRHNISTLIATPNNHSGE